MSTGRVKSLAIVGAGWAGLAAAVHAVQQGHRVTVFEMAPQPGGRAREVMQGDVPLDNGQHILIGAYVETLRLMRSVGADPDRLLERRPLALLDPWGRGLSLPRGAVLPAFVRGVFGLDRWSWRERIALLAAAARWRLGGFEAPVEQTVAELTSGLPPRVRREVTDALCVAALNTPAEHASARVFLRVLRDALFAGPGSADLLLPRVSLSALWPEPALVWLQGRGTAVRCAARVQRIEPGWRVDGEPFDAVLLACSAAEAARLATPIAPDWARIAGSMSYEPIMTVYLHSAGSRWPHPMVSLAGDPARPAQFAFDLGALDASGRREGLFAFVVSGARAWVERGAADAAAAVLAQAREDFPASAWASPPVLVRSLSERRATFLCTPGLQRPPARIAPGLAAAGDFVSGPYPATLEGAVRSALAAVAVLNDAAV